MNNNEQQLENLLDHALAMAPELLQERRSSTWLPDYDEGTLLWPSLGDLRLPDQLLAARRQCLGGSDANVLFSGDAARIRQLWLEKRGEVDVADLSARLPVALGSWTEAFNRQWFEQQTGQKVILAGTSLTCSTYSWRRCTLDGFVEGGNAVWEAKHTSSFARAEDLIDRYMPQLQHNMALAQADRAILSVIFGNSKFEVFEIASDWLYQIDLLDAEVEFWDCVLTVREPVAVEAPPAPKPVGTREVCLEGNNSWAAAAADWVENRAAAKTHTKACETIRNLVEADVSKAFGHGIEAKRSKSGAISIRELAR